MPAISVIGITAHDSPNLVKDHVQRFLLIRRKRQPVTKMASRNLLQLLRDCSVIRELSVTLAALLQCLVEIHRSLKNCIIAYVCRQGMG